ncbi:MULTISPECIES: LysR family transcriptional regulator [Sporosarcina]|uniref:DNA-binding transcriptional regulator, LysR family n=2 Tax=Sporosarcina newyorkensis TaxID=759851 RepID=A0A1T4YXQ2_9BACL|nr:MULTISPECIES: LysR family transcriptional regulator [Sporosarcina]EGQ24617.1 transcriptional regulatory protein [Sporosarcina newyorkensis 2681]MBY0222859.1 LysR family transcriptional regulator [Sporosarcina aquimarina]SKB06071.1 DNA-binding transcriptional regulator, LysR family [Sporosarcina newyorkensis]
MSINLEWYKVFRKVVQNESFSKAARQLFMTQPAVSQIISQLERELDTRLFNRTSKGVSLTDEGSLLFEYVNSALNLIDAGNEKLYELKNLSAGELKIGVGDTISRYYLLPYLEAFHTNYPSIRFKIINGTTVELIAALKSGEADIAVCNFPVEDETLEKRVCFDVQDAFVYGDRFKKLFLRPVPLQELTKLPLILLESKSNSRQYVEDFLSEKGVKIYPEFELGSHELLLEFAQINLGIACVVKEFSADYLDSGKLQEVEFLEPIPKRSIGVCYLKGVSLSPSASKFIEILEKD